MVAMTNPRWPTVLFDLDGTLANTIPLILASYRWTIEEYGLEPADDATILSWIGRTLPDMFAELAGDRGPQVIEGYTAWQLAHVDDLLEPYDGMAELVADLAGAGVRLGIATSRRRVGAERLVAALGLDEHLAVVVAMEDTHRHKPDAAPLLLAARRLGVDSATAVYVGDALVDLRAAGAAGMAGVGVTWGAGVPDALRGESAVAVVDTPTQLRAQLLG